ncbi:hypothetical protein MGN70_008764 [Eutypa lata]|nr:hypothetical protein MGN70_008764 [Eutypa lata]
MADPFTIVGLAAGLASLGIQVCGGITTYLDGIKCQADDIASVKRQVQSLESVLQAVRTTLPRIDSSHQVSTTAVVECLRSFEAELETLGKFVSKLTADIVTPTKFKDKVKEQTKKLTYPFNRSKLNQLEARLVQVNGIFQTSLQGLDLGISSSSLKTLEANSRATSADLLVVRSGVELSNNTLPSIQQSVDSLAPLITSQTETLSSQIENSGIRTQDTIQRLQGDFQSLVLHQLNRIEQSFQRSDQSNYARLERIVSELYSKDVKGRKGEQYQSSEVVVGRLIAKPNNLGSLCNEFSSLPRSSQSFTQEPLASFKSTLLQSSVNSGGASYIYGRRKRRQRQRIRWGPFEFYDEHTLTEENLLDSNISKAISRHRSIGLKYMGVANLLSRAINIAFSMSSGAGGFSIAPSFTYYATVDERIAPAFRLLDLLHVLFIA